MTCATPRRIAIERAIIALSVIALVLAALLGFVLVESQSIVRTVTVTSSETLPVTGSTFSSTSSPLSLGSCLLPVEASANSTLYENGSIVGTMVTYGPGQQVFFPQDLCPQPVSNVTYSYSAGFQPKIPDTNDYQLAVDAVSNPRFDSLENGTTFLYSQPGFPRGYSTTLNGDGVYGAINGTNGYSFSLFFFNYSDVINNCFGNVMFNVTAGIEANFFAPFQQTVSGAAVPGTWNLNDPTIHALTPGEITTEDLCSVA
jgi:hypothetical protein